MSSYGYRLTRPTGLEYLQDVDAWFVLRDIRNQLGHDYVDELVTIINIIFAKKEQLERYFVTIVSKLGND